MAKKAQAAAGNAAPAKTKAIKKVKAAPAAPAAANVVAPVIAKKNSEKKVNYQFDNLYILLLDMSGSMWGQGWEDLMNAVKQFLTAVQTDPQLQAKSRVSIITYDDNAYLIKDQQIPHLFVGNNIDMREGGTDFERPLQMALKHMQDNNNKYGSFTVCMMTDGQAPYPAKAVNDILKSGDVVGKM